MNQPVDVVHLVRRANGVEPFARFIESYVRFEAGTPCRLVLAAKGFPEAIMPRAWSQVMEHAGLAPDVVPMSDAGFDLAAYRRAASQSQAPLVCLLNSFSQIDTDGWLDALRGHAGPGCVAGATGSWESRTSHMWSTLSSALGGLPPWRRPVPAVRSLSALTSAYVRFRPFPNPHLRTNCLVIEPACFLEMTSANLHTKFLAERAESGRQGMTKRLLAAGVRCVVVGRDREAYEWADWPQSATFRSGGQTNLLVHDNRTLEFANADAATRADLASRAWGDRAV